MALKRATAVVSGVLLLSMRSTARGMSLTSAEAVLRSTVSASATKPALCRSRSGCRLGQTTRGISLSDPQ
jgi:hypothetical protein